MKSACSTSWLLTSCSWNMGRDPCPSARKSWQGKNATLCNLIQLENDAVLSKPFSLAFGTCTLQLIQCTNMWCASCRRCPIIEIVTQNSTQQQEAPCRGRRKHRYNKPEPLKRPFEKCAVCVYDWDWLWSELEALWLISMWSTELFVTVFILISVNQQVKHVLLQCTCISRLL